MTRRGFSVLFAFLFVVATAVLTIGFAAAPTQAKNNEIAHFQSPSGNINCEMFQLERIDVANCIIKDNAWKTLPKVPADCGLDWSPAELGLTSDKQGSTIKNSVNVGACRGDIGPVCTPTCIPLAYGKSARVRRLTCTSLKSGVTCVANRGKRRGFTIARSGYKTF